MDRASSTPSTATATFVPGNGDLTYDWIGFDPRGVGDSKPALTCDPKFYGYDRPPYKPDDAAIERRLAQPVRELREGVQELAGRQVRACSTT